MRDAISVIIPVFNEEDTITETVRGLKGPMIREIIVVDGGSTDSSVEKAESAGCKVIKSVKKGRASQMNTGAANASSPVLYFLHSDTHPPANFAKRILEAVHSGSGYGCFSLQFNDKHPVLRFYAKFTRLKMKWVRFGDQSLFVKTDLFERINGFDETLIVMEDQEIYHRLEKVGKFKLLDGEVTTSARRYRSIGILKLQFYFSMIFMGYYLGVSQSTLLHFYKNQIRTK